MLVQDEKCQIYIRTKDRDRLEKLAKLSFRRSGQQLAVLINDAAKALGLDPDTLEPVAAQPEAAAPG